MFAEIAHMACQNSRERRLWVRPSNHAWFDMADTESLRSPFLLQPRMRYGKNHNKKGLEQHRRDTNEFCGTVSRLPVPSLPPGGGLGTPKMLGTGATLHLGPIRLHDQNWEYRALKSSARCQKFGVPCRFFSACKWGLSVVNPKPNQPVSSVGRISSGPTLKVLK